MATPVTATSREVMPRTALVTGGARRIGAALCRALAQDGFALAIHCRHSGDDARALAAELEATGARAEVFAADLADPAETDALIPTVTARMGPLGLLVNNASIFEPDVLPALNRAAFARAHAVNFVAPVFLTQAFAASLPADAEGLVVHLLDQRVLKPTPEFFSYATAKQALHGALPMMAQALAPRIRVNAIAPGPTLKGERQDDDDFARQSAATPLGRGAGLDEFGAALKFLLAARSLTGQTLVLDGGQHLNWQTPDVVGIVE